MKKYNFLIALLLIFNLNTAQKKSTMDVDFSILKDAKMKIEGTVPVFLKQLQGIATQEGDKNIFTNGNSALGKQYAILESEWGLYKGNMNSCILNNSSKNAKKCLDYHTQYLRNTLNNYKNYITHLSRKNGTLGDDENNGVNFNPTEITTKLSETYSNANASVGKMKGSKKSEFLGETLSEEYKLKPFTEFAQ